MTPMSTRRIASQETANRQLSQFEWPGKRGTSPFRQPNVPFLTYDVAKTHWPGPAAVIVSSPGRSEYCLPAGNFIVTAGAGSGPCGLRDREQRQPGSSGPFSDEAVASAYGQCVRSLKMTIV